MTFRQLPSLRSGRRALAPAALLGIVLLCAFAAPPLAFANYEEARAALERGEHREGFAAMRAAAYEGDARASNHLGTLFEDGASGVKRDFARAIYWYRKAAESGLAEGQLNLGRMYRVGLGVRRDEQRAAAWYRTAALQGSAPAQFFLGLMHAAGHGIKRDPVLAWVWLTLAAEQGDEDAIFRRDRLTAELGENGLTRGQEELQRVRDEIATAVASGAASAPTSEKAAVEGTAAPVPPPPPPGPPPVRGDPLIFHIQTALRELGYDPGEADGQDGKNTRDALRLFERERRFSVRGRLDERSLARLRDAIEAGKMASSVVREIQSRLLKLDLPVGPADGKAGPKTAAAVREFQRDQGLPVDGRISPELLQHLRELGS